MTPKMRLVAGAALLALATGGVLSSCSEAEQKANAHRIASRTELIGGPSALGEVGDFLLENDKIRVIIQDRGFSRGFGVYGGSLIDADLQRPLPEGGVEGTNGRDQFGELFPVFFLQALEPSDQPGADGTTQSAVEIIADGSDGEAAKVQVRGRAADFLTMTKALNRAILNSHDLPRSPLDLLNPDELPETQWLAYDVTYELPPGERYVKITTRMRNTKAEPLPIPSQLGKTLLALLRVNTDNFRVPLGFVLLFGSGNDVFTPGYGYDVRFSLEESFEQQLPFPALSGLLTPGIISTSDRGISYGFFSTIDPEVESFANHRVDADGKNFYEEAYGVEVDEGSMLVPFLASSFTGVFYAQAPEQLAPAGEAGDSFQFTTYFVVGDGDGASVLDEMHRLRGTTTGGLVGEVREAKSGDLVEGASVVIYDDEGRPVNQVRSDAAGRVRGALEPGRYTARVQRHPLLADAVAFDIEAGQDTFLTLAAPEPAYIAVQVTDEDGQALPAKISVVGTSAAAEAGKPLREFLFDLAAGEHWRTDDVVADDADDASTRRYIEAIEYTTDGHVVVAVRPGIDYEVFVSRGPEYTVQRDAVTVEAGGTAQLAASLRRVVDTTGYISADFHVHAQPSLDSEVPLDDRVRQGAAEGLEFLVATDHNFITDYQPYIERLGLEQWVSSMIGLELTTLESGHFNGYPMKREAAEITKGSFEWSLQPPQSVFDAIRAQGAVAPEDTVVQVNHARDGIMGYFDQYGLDPLTATIPPRVTAGLDLARVIEPSGPAFGTRECEPDDDPDDMREPECTTLSTFSFDFDVVEILNGGMPVAQIHHTRVPPTLRGLGLPAELRDQLPAAGTILCDEDDEVAYPGVIDDWFNLLNRGERKYAAVGNSDSHHADDIGWPRNYVRVGRDDPSKLTPREVTKAVKDGRAVIITNGPFVELFVDGGQVGDEVTAADGEVAVKVRIRAAPWVDVQRGALYANGEVVERFDVSMGDGEFEWEKTLTLAKDTWLLVEVEGDRSMFPVVKPVDIAPFLLNDAFATLAGPLGLGGGDLAKLEPARTGFFKPFAITNPIWVVADGDGQFTPPGIPPRRCRSFGVELDEGGGVAKSAPALRTRVPELLSRERFVPSFGFPRIKGDVHDVRLLFEHFASHGH